MNCKGEEFKDDLNCQRNIFYFWVGKVNFMKIICNYQNKMQLRGGYGDCGFQF